MKEFAKIHIPLKGHRWHKNSDESLKFIMKDADEARRAVSSHGTIGGNKAALKYEDQINDASTILGWRRRNPNWQKITGPVSLSANLKPALRELAARSERIVEFALVRDAKGQLVEDNGGGGVATAAKVGAAAAVAGGAGYGGYKAYQYGKDKFRDQFVAKNTAMHLNSPSGSTPVDFAKAAAQRDFAKLGKFRKVTGSLGVAAMTLPKVGFNAAKSWLSSP